MTWRIPPDDELVDPHEFSVNCGWGHRPDQIEDWRRDVVSEARASLIFERLSEGQDQYEALDELVETITKTQSVNKMRELVTKYQDLAAFYEETINGITGG